MSHPKSLIVTDKDGLRGTIETASERLPNDESHVSVLLDNGRRVMVPTDMLVLRGNDSYYLPIGMAQLEQDRSADKINADAIVIPLIAEEPDIRKQKVETNRVRVTKIVREQETEIDVPLMKEEFEVRRIPMNRIVDGPIPIRYEDNTTILSVLEEVLVVEKRLILREEVHITKHRSEVHKPEKVILHNEEAKIERVAGQEDKKEHDRDLT